MKFRTLWMTVIVLLIAAGLRTWQIESQSIWFDEGFSWHAATQSNLLTTLNGDPTNPPLYYLLLHIWVRLMGESEFSLRALSLAQGVILLSLMFYSAYRWFGSRAALVTAATGAFLPLLWWASQEARMYNTLAIAVLLMTLGLSNILIHPQYNTRKNWIMLLAGELAALYTHNTGVVVFGAVNIVFGLFWVVGQIRKRRGWRMLRDWIIGQIMIVVLWLPELAARFQTVNSANQASSSPPQISLILLWQSWQALWANSWRMVLAKPTDLHIAAALLLPLLIVALFALRQRAGRLLIAMHTALYIALVAALIVLGVNFHGRYLVMLAPLFVIVTAAGLEQLPTNETIKNTLAALIVTAGGVVWALLPGQTNPDYQHDQARRMVAHYTNNLHDHDLVLTWSYAERYELSYYWERMQTPGHLVTLPDGAAPTEIVDIINSYITDDNEPFRAEINTWFTQGSDRRGSLPCIIGHNHPAPGPTHFVVGMATTPYELQGKLTAPEFQADSTTNFANIIQLDIAAVSETSIAANNGICIPLTFTLLQETDEDLTAAVNALNGFNWEIANADTPILDAAQIPTSRLSPGDSIRAFPLFYFPQGTPPGTYSANLRLYSPDNTAGLDVLDWSSSTPSGKDANLGELSVTAGAWPDYDTDCATVGSPGTMLTDCTVVNAETVSAGQMLNLTLHWQIEDAPQPITLTISGTDWAATDTQTPPVTGAFLDWRAIPIPAEAAGTAVLTAQIANNPPVELAQFEVEKPEHLMAPPPFAQSSAITFPGVGSLTGFTIETPTITSITPLEVTLVWQSSGTTAIPYTLTVQLLSAEGIVLAQHDSQPANNERPTTGWIDQEYIVDPHTLIFKEDAVNYSGPTSLIVAFYDAATGERVTLDTGNTHAVLTEGLTITSD